MKSHIFSLTFVFICSLGLAACQPSLETSESSSCAANNISISCLLDAAHTTLKETQDPFVWASGASELAVAYDVANRREEAEGLIDKAIIKAKSIDDVKKRGTALGEILTAISVLSETDKVPGWAQEIGNLALQLEAREKAEIPGKIIVAKAVHIDPKAAFSEALNMPQEADVQGYAKAITLRKIANILAKTGDMETARKAVDSITMSITYYQSMVRSDVARHAYKKGDKAFALALLKEADPIARSLGNGYFIGAGLRDIGFSYHSLDMPEEAQSYFAQALEATAKAEKQNEKARSTSRVATRLSDAGLNAQTERVLKQAAAYADRIEADNMKAYAYYEIAGSAGISGQFYLAKKWLENVPDTPLSSTSSLRSAVERDLAWGLARYNKVEEALNVARNIKAPREKIQALSRMIRVMKNPDMAALPRYL